MRKRNCGFYIIMVLLAIFSLSGCDKSKEDIDFGNEVINDKVEIPNWNSLTDIFACYDADGKNVYSLGTVHGTHLNPSFGYSLQDIQSVIEHVKPDYVFIESREEIFEKYGAIDGPIEFQFIYSYCKEQNIPVEFIDYWSDTYDDLLENSNTTSDKRDNQIFYNIYDKMKQVKKGETVLICYGTGHFFYQQPRMERAGWKEIAIENEEEYFSHINEIFFEYPEGMSELIQNTINFYEKDFIEHVKECGTNPDIIPQIQERFQSGAESYKLIKELIDNNQLYFSEELINKDAE